VPIDGGHHRLDSRRSTHGACAVSSAPRRGCDRWNKIAHQTCDRVMTERLRAVIADDHYLVREGTRQVVESTGEVHVVATVGDAAELVDAVDRLEPDAVVVDIRMPPDHHLEGIEAAHVIRARHPGIGIVVLSQHISPLYAFAVFKSGTDGLAYLLKDRVGDRDELLRAIATVAEGGSVIDPLVVDALLARGRSAGNPMSALTHRELEILGRMAEGKSNQAITECVHLSMSSVEKHINVIFSKLGLERADTSVNRRVAAVLAFVHEQTTPGLTSEPPVA
jgi:DNA-binding NarL/FixJ family response regulator